MIDKTTRILTTINELDEESFEVLLEALADDEPLPVEMGDVTHDEVQHAIQMGAAFVKGAGNASNN